MTGGAADRHVTLEERNTHLPVKAVRTDVRYVVLQNAGSGKTSATVYRRAPLKKRTLPFRYSERR